MEVVSLQGRVADYLTALRSHPFIEGAERRELSVEQAKRWVFCAGRESRSFPSILTGLLEWAEGDVIRGVIQENLDDEFGQGDPEDAHFMHYLHLLDSMGVRRAEFDGYAEGAGIRFALSLAFNVATSRNLGQALGYMILNEAMTPVTYEAARKALTTHFPLLVTDFFDLHISVDAEHVDALYRAAETVPPEAENDVHFGLALAQRGMEILLDEAYGVLDHHQGDIDVTRLAYG